METKIVAALTRISAPYLRDPVGVTPPTVNGVEVIESRESLTVIIHALFPDEGDLLIATEILEMGILDSSGTMCLSLRQLEGKLEIKFVFGREKVLGLSPEAISSLGSAGRFIYEYVGDSPIVSSFKDRLRAEVLSSKVRLSAEIRTAISHTSRLFASHSSAGIRGA